MGPPLILIMGTGLDCSCWTPQVEAYQQEFDCIRFDNRGTGKTQAPSVPLSVPLMAEDAAALLESLEAGPAHVSGLSLGSCIAQELALNRPELVLTLQLHGTWGRAHEVPTLITVGSFDLALPPMYAQEVAAAIPNSELVIFQNGGHLHNIEQPEEFNRVTLDFLHRHLTAPPV